MKEILIVLMFIVPLFANAQEYGNLASKDSLNINTDSLQSVVDSIMEVKLKKRANNNYWWNTFWNFQRKSPTCIKKQIWNRRLSFRQ